MEYGIREVSELAGVSARTLRYYDEIGLLKPCRISESGYRFYGERELELLQQILFYRERGFDLKEIRKALYQENFDILSALEEHLLELEKQQTLVEEMIATVKQTIAAKKGEVQMSQREKFEVFKKNLIDENEKTYGTEIREKYGHERVEESNRKMLHMSQADWEHFKRLEQEILEKLQSAVQAAAAADSVEAKEVVALHREWLCMTWPKNRYSPEAHKGLAAMYVADERFRKYYDTEVEGCAKLLVQAIRYWAEKL